jgi:hypothetical protein
MSVKRAVSNKFIGHDGLWGKMQSYLVLEVNGCVEVGDLRVGGLDHHLALAGVDELAHLKNGGRRAHITLLEPATS